MNIVVPGDPNVMADALRSLVMVLGTSGGGDNYILGMIKMGLMASLLITLIQGVLMHGFRLDKFLLHFVLVMAFFLPRTSVTIESSSDPSTVGAGFYAPQVVDDVPLISAIPLSIGTTVGSSIARRIDDAFRPIWVDSVFCGGPDSCSILTVFRGALTNFAARFTGLDRDAVIARNLSEFGRYCDPNGSRPHINQFLRSDVVSQWDKFCTTVTSDKKIVWASVHGDLPKVGPRGQLLSSSGTPLAPNMSCAEACQEVKNLLEDESEVFLFAGCKPGSDCYNKSEEIFDKILYINAQLGLEDANRIKRNFVFACALDSLTENTDPLGLGVASSRLESSGCQEWSNTITQKLTLAQGRQEAAESRSVQWMVLLSAILPIIMLTASVSFAWFGKVLPVYAFYLIFISSPNIVYSVSDGIFASQVENLYRTAYSAVSSGIPGHPGTPADSGLQCDGDPACHVNTAQVLMQVATAAEAAADFQITGHLALLGIFAAVGGLSAVGMMMSGGGPAGAGGSSAGAGSGAAGAANGLGSGAMVGATAVMDAQIGRNFYGGGSAGILSMDALSTAAAFRSAAPGLLGIAGAGPGAATGAGRATADSSSGLSTSYGSDTSATQSFSRAISSENKALINKAYSDAVEKARSGAITTESGLRQTMAANLERLLGVSREDANKVAGQFLASLGATLSNGGGGLGDLFKSGQGKSAGQNLLNALPSGKVGADASIDGIYNKSTTGSKRRVMNATGNEGVSADQGRRTTFGQSDKESESARIDKAINDAFEESFSKMLSAAEQARQGMNAENSLRTGSSYAMPTAGDIMGFNILGMIRSGVRDSVGARDFLLNQLAKGGLSSNQINDVMRGIDQQMLRNQDFGYFSGQTANLLASAVSAIQNMAVRGDEASRRTAMQAGLALIGQGDAARTFAAQMAEMDKQRGALQEQVAGQLREADALRKEVDDRLRQGMEMANTIAGDVLKNNAVLRQAVQEELQKMAQESKQLNREAVNQVLTNAINRVLGSNLNQVEASQAFELANKAAREGVDGLIKGISNMTGASPDAVKAALTAAGVLTAAGNIASVATGAVNIAGSAGRAAANVAKKAVATAAISGALHGGAPGRMMTVGAEVLSHLAKLGKLARVAGAVTPWGAIALAIDLAVGAVTGKSVTDRVINAVFGGGENMPGNPGPAAPVAQNQTPVSPAQQFSGGPHPGGDGPGTRGIENVFGGPSIIPQSFNSGDGAGSNLVNRTNAKGAPVAATPPHQGTPATAPTQVAQGTPVAAPAQVAQATPTAAPTQVAQGTPTAQGTPATVPTQVAFAGTAPVGGATNITPGANQGIDTARITPSGPSIASPSMPQGTQVAGFDQLGAGTGGPSIASPASMANNSPTAFAELGQGLSGAGGLPDLGIIESRAGANPSAQTMSVALTASPAGNAAGSQGGNTASAPRGPSALTQSGVPVSAQGGVNNAVPVTTGNGSRPPVV